MLAAQLLASVGLLQSLYVTVPTAIVLGLIAVLMARRAAQAGDAQRVRRAQRGGAVRDGARLGRAVRRDRRVASRWPCTACCAGLHSRTITRPTTLCEAVFEIGNSLREARLRRGVDFAQAEVATKIRGKYLRALEDEQFELLPAQTYVKGFLRTYAEYLGLDGQLYVDEFNSRFVGR